MPSAYKWNGYYIMLAKQVYHTATPYIISHKRYIIEKCNNLCYNKSISATAASWTQMTAPYSSSWWNRSSLEPAASRYSSNAVSASKRTTNKAQSPRQWSPNHSRGRFLRSFEKSFLFDKLVAHRTTDDKYCAYNL